MLLVETLSFTDKNYLWGHTKYVFDIQRMGFEYPGGVSKNKDIKVNATKRFSIK